MELNKNKWLNSDIGEFEEYLKSLSNTNKVEWTKNIYATKKPCLAIKIPVLRNIAKEICKGDYLGFLKLQTHDFIEDDILTAIIISNIKDYDLQKNQAVEYLKNVDSWCCTDILKLNNKNFMLAYELSLELYKSKYVFCRRFAFVQLLKFAKQEQNIDAIFQFIESANKEQEYYVNMAISWLICEIMIYFPEKTINFLNNYKNNYKQENNIFIIKKSISKCLDSYRIALNYKEILKNMR